LQKKAEKALFLAFFPFFAILLLPKKDKSEYHRNDFGGH